MLRDLRRMERESSDPIVKRTARTLAKRVRAMRQYLKDREEA